MNCHDDWGHRLAGFRAEGRKKSGLSLRATSRARPGRPIWRAYARTTNPKKKTRTATTQIIGTDVLSALFSGHDPEAFSKLVRLADAELPAVSASGAACCVLRVCRPAALGGTLWAPTARRIDSKWPQGPLRKTATTDQAGGSIVGALPPGWTWGLASRRPQSSVLVAKPGCLCRCNCTA